MVKPIKRLRHVETVSAYICVHVGVRSGAFVLVFGLCGMCNVSSARRFPLFLKTHTDLVLYLHYNHNSEA